MVSLILKDLVVVLEAIPAVIILIPYIGSPRFGAVVKLRNSTLIERDRTFQKRIYARAGIAVYYVIKSSLEQQIEVYTEPNQPWLRNQHISSVRDYSLCDQVSVVIEGRFIDRCMQDLLLLP
jgi:hypothetical protein